MAGFEPAQDVLNNVYNLYLIIFRRLEKNLILRHELMMLSSSSATELVIDDVDAVRYALSMNIQNVHESARVFLGDSTVTTSDYGYILEPGLSFSLDDVSKYPGLYAITDTNNSKVAIIRVSK